MLKRPRSSLPTTRRMRASRFSARSSGGMSRVPIAAWNVRLSRLRTRTVFRNELIKFVGSAVGGTGRGILPRGPRTTPRRFPMTGMRGASAMKKSYDIAGVHGDLDGLFERAGLGGLEQLLDCLDRMLVRQGRSPPAVRAAVGPPAEESRRKSVPLIRLCGHTAAVRFTGEGNRRGRVRGWDSVLDTGR